MTDLDMWSALVGLGLPVLVAVVNRSAWPGWRKGVVVAGSSVLAGGVTAWLAGSLTGGTWLHSALVVGMAAVGSWRLFWKPTGIGPAIERATEPGQPGLPAVLPLRVPGTDR